MRSPRGALLAVVLAAATGIGCGNPSECAIGTQRCHGGVPQLCAQNVALSDGVGIWIGEAPCDPGKVCRVEQSGAALCVPP